jgi:hypothetical protein
MNPPISSVRIPADLDQRLPEYVATHGMAQSQFKRTGD